VFLVAIVVVVAFAIWLAVTGHYKRLPGRPTRDPSLRGCGGDQKQLLCPRADLLDLEQLRFGEPRVSRGDACASRPRARRTARRSEIEQGTNRLAWTQSITRTRWLLVKLGVGALACCAIVGAMAPLLEWWTGVIHRGARILPSLFDISGFVDVAYVLFAFMLELPWRAHPPDRMGLRGGNSPLCARPVRCAGLRSAKSVSHSIAVSPAVSPQLVAFHLPFPRTRGSALRRCAPWSFQSRSWPDLAERLPNGRKLPGRRREPGTCESLYRREQAPLRRPVPADESLLGLARHRERDLHRAALVLLGITVWP